ncbi:unnamed protein product [Phytophthora fragariaefolia]|uniref:Unnamed protein product n=1 Tax=Phytophthora fragariaefolia TaxID=1490495 RepID=A0A9W6TLQ9_9STRA|nr:unnamed protein product [Phytophthora fragariaefolia]
MAGGPAKFDMERTNNLLVVRAEGYGGRQSEGDVLISVLADSQAEIGPDVQTDTLVLFHHRLRHLNYDTILRMARDPASGISLTDEKRADCLTCVLGKQIKNLQLRKDTEANPPLMSSAALSAPTSRGP